MMRTRVRARRRGPVADAPQRRRKRKGVVLLLQGVPIWLLIVLPLVAGASGPWWVSLGACALPFSFGYGYLYLDRRRRFLIAFLVMAFVLAGPLALLFIGILDASSSSSTLDAEGIAAFGSFLLWADAVIVAVVGLALIVDVLRLAPRYDA